MRLSVIGCGYLGAVHAAAMASLGHSVVGIDSDRSKVARLQAGEAPFFEPGLPELLREGLASGRLRFTSDLDAAAACRLHFVCVGTPQRADGLGADLGDLEAVVTSLGPKLRNGAVLVGKSTVPVGTARRLARAVSAAGAELVWNPEFLREGHAVSDTLAPDRIVYGLATPPSSAGSGVIDELYQPMLDAGVPRLTMSFESAELVKTSANSYLALRVSFINGVADMADAAGADVTDVASALRLDERIGRLFLNPGLGFGGGCLPKDLRALTLRAEQLGVPKTASLLAAVDQINSARPDRVVDLAAEALGGSVAGHRVAVLGLSFKPLSDDIRNSQSVVLAKRLAAAGAEVVATDPQAARLARQEHSSLGYATTVREAVAGADLVVLATEWEEYRSLNPVAVATWTQARAVVDARLVLDPAEWSAAG
ncbi:MAG: UDP-glucose/GDP-mannose dehydrogenase family protein, partial [Bifidobacteriaceae bacterium]|nr:UDP-glucose/GDP-mannose dehydrogenase family protein [Bifidobacteriaceae bacterium]